MYCKMDAYHFFLNYGKNSYFMNILTLFIILSNKTFVSVFLKLHGLLEWNCCMFFVLIGCLLALNTSFWRNVLCFSICAQALNVEEFIYCALKIQFCGLETCLFIHCLNIFIFRFIINYFLLQSGRQLLNWIS